MFCMADEGCLRQPLCECGNVHTQETNAQNQLRAVLLMSDTVSIWQDTKVKSVPQADCRCPLQSQPLDLHR